MPRFLWTISGVTMSAILSACSSSAPGVDASSTSAALKKAPSCRSTGDCDRAFDDGSWKVSSKLVDKCVAEHDFASVCISCSNHTCAFSVSPDPTVPSCNTVNDCNKAFENGTWKISAKVVDDCVANHDFPYICMACDTDHTCSFNPDF